jgi:hypothetical protein
MSNSAIAPTRTTTVPGQYTAKMHVVILGRDVEEWLQDRGARNGRSTDGQIAIELERLMSDAVHGTRANSD